MFSLRFQMLIVFISYYTVLYFTCFHWPIGLFIIFNLFWLILPLEKIHNKVSSGHIQFPKRLTNKIKMSPVLDLLYFIFLVQVFVLFGFILHMRFELMGLSLDGEPIGIPFFALGFCVWMFLLLFYLKLNE